MMSSCVVVIMGVAGSGKTTIAHLLAKKLGWDVADADDFHPSQNIDKMSRGLPLTDQDREPWLAAIAAWIDAHQGAGRPGIVTCSALKRRYRDIIIDGRESVRLVYLRGPKELIAERMAARAGHFMPPALLASQFEALEEPSLDEGPLVIDIQATPDAIIETIVQSLEQKR